MTRHKRDFKIRRMETRVTANTIADTEYYTLPDDYIAMRNIKLNSDPKTSLRECNISKEGNFTHFKITHKN